MANQQFLVNLSSLLDNNINLILKIGYSRLEPTSYQHSLKTCLEQVFNFT